MLASIRNHRRAPRGAAAAPGKGARPGPSCSLLVLPHVLQHVQNFRGQVRVLHVKLREVGLQQGGRGLLRLQGRVLLLETQNPAKQRSAHLEPQAFQAAGVSTVDGGRAARGRSDGQQARQRPPGRAARAREVRRTLLVPLGQRQHLGPLPRPLPGDRRAAHQRVGQCGHLQGKRRGRVLSQDLMDLASASAPSTCPVGSLQAWHQLPGSGPACPPAQHTGTIPGTGDSEALERAPGPQA